MDIKRTKVLRINLPISNFLFLPQIDLNHQTVSSSKKVKIFVHFEVENLRVVFEDHFLGLVLQIEFLDFKSVLGFSLKVNSVFVYQIRTGKFIDRLELIKA